MVFAHGFGCDQHMWRHVAPRFEDDFQVVLFDLAGAGESDPGSYDPARYDSLAAYAEDVLVICDELDLRQVIFVGHSVSAMIGVLAAVEAPDRFAKLVLVGPSPRYTDDGSYVGGFTAADIEDFASTHRSAMASDIDGAPVFLAKSAWEIGYVAERYPKVGFERTKERG